MKVVVPYAPGKLHPITKGILESYRLPVEYVCVRGTYGYSKLLKRLWDERETVIIVEHDIAPWPGAIEELYYCVGKWCSCSYLYGGGYGLYHCLGCVKISNDLMARIPSLWDKPVKWDVCDGHLFHNARDVGEEPHPHRPPVIHLSTQELSYAANHVPI